MSSPTELQFVQNAQNWVDEVLSQSLLQKPQSVTFTFREIIDLNIHRQKHIILQYIVPHLEEQGYQCRLVFIRQGAYLDLMVSSSEDMVSQQMDDQNPFISSDEDSTDEEDEEDEEEDGGEEDDEDMHNHYAMPDPVMPPVEDQNKVYRRAHYIISEIPDKFPHCICGIVNDGGAR